MTNRNLILYPLIAIMLVVGVFAYASYDQVAVARAKAETDIAIQKQPAVIQGAANLGITLTVKIVAAVVSSLVISLVVALIYQINKVREMQAGGHERFWQRRNVKQQQSSKTKPPTLTEVVTMLIAQNLDKKQ